MLGSTYLHNSFLSKHLGYTLRNYKVKDILGLLDVFTSSNELSVFGAHLDGVSLEVANGVGVHGVGLVDHVGKVRQVASHYKNISFKGDDCYFFKTFIKRLWKMRSLR